MKKLLLFFIVFIFPFFVPLTVLYAEEIPSFDADIAIRKDGKFDVSERILYDFGDLQKHGIYRTIPYKKTNAEGKQFLMDFSDIKVMDDEKLPYHFTSSRDGSAMELKVGDANKTISGKHSYDIFYTVEGGLTYFSDHDELYWQVTGTEWQVPIEHASVTVRLPETIAQSELSIACFTGVGTSALSDCVSEVLPGQVTVRTKQALSPGEGLTVVFGFPKNIVAVVEPREVNTWFSDMLATVGSILLVLGAIGWYLILPIWIVFHWFQVGRDPVPPMGVTHAWFDVPKTEKDHRQLTPGETGTLIDEKAEMREITATMVDLARRGYLKIVEKKKGDFFLEKQSKAEKGDTLEVFEKTIYDGIFADSEESIRVKDADLIEPIADAKKQLYEAVVKERFFVSNPETIRVKYTVIGVLALFTINFPLALASFIFGRAIPRKTMTGSQNAAIAQSLKNFIVSQDRQYAYQAKKQLFFEKFLPYAIVFGVEKIWAERFKDVGLKKPDWYDGYDMRTFNSIYLVNSLGSSFHSVAQAATPTSSSSGFSSGFSGGSVGGGGGGGGGGSW